MKPAFTPADLDKWLKDGRYLPECLRDFHDQKEVFKAIDEIIPVRPQDSIKRPSWIEAQCYVIDIFLWFMARRGYTLRKTRKKGVFRDLDADVTNQTAKRLTSFSAMLRGPSA